MKSVYDVVIKPYITEKVVNDNPEGNRVVFIVHPSANKIEIKHAVEELFKVQVENVRILNQVGKKKRMGRYEGRVSSMKKAMITLKKGDKIEYFEGA